MYVFLRVSIPLFSTKTWFEGFHKIVITIGDPSETYRRSIKDQRASLETH